MHRAADCQRKVQERRLQANSVTDMTEFSSRLSGGKNGLIKWFFWSWKSGKSKCTVSNLSNQRAPLCYQSVCEVFGGSTHQGRFDANALGSLESQGQIPDLKKNKPSCVETLGDRHGASNSKNKYIYKPLQKPKTQSWTKVRLNLFVWAFPCIMFCLIA